MLYIRGMYQYGPVCSNTDLRATNTTVEMDSAPGSHMTRNIKYIKHSNKSIGVCNEVVGIVREWKNYKESAKIIPEGNIIKESIVNISRYGSKDYALVVLSHSEVTLLEKREGTVFCLSVYCVLVTYSIAVSEQYVVEFPVFHISGGILSRPAAFLILIFSTTLSSSCVNFPRVMSCRLLIIFVIGLSVTLEYLKKGIWYVPQSWIINYLKMYKISAEVINFIEKILRIMELTAGGRSLAKIQRRIFQGNALSLLLFIIAMMPLNHILRKYTAEYKLSWSQEKINHLIRWMPSNHLQKMKKNWKRS